MKGKGSITVFLVLTLTCFFSAVFAFLEAARVSGLKANAGVSALQAGDTVLASYQRDLWEKYHLMFWESGGDFPELQSLGGLQQSAVNGNRTDHLFPGKNYDLLRVSLDTVKVQKYELVTDYGGAAFRRQAAEMMRQTAGQNTLQAVLDWLNGTGGIREEENDLANQALGALETLEDAKQSTEDRQEGTEGAGEAAAEAAEPQTELPEQTVEVSENPLEWVKEIQKNGIYAFLMPEEELSQKSIDLDTCVGKRDLNEGNYPQGEDSQAMEKLLFRLYLDQYFLDASEEAEDGALDYELEYIIVGKAKDEANLKGTVRRLLLMREAANLLFLETNAAKRQQTAAIALTLTSAIGHPELQPLVEQGVLAAWAYAESLSDMKILLNGGKVMPVKTEEQWHTDIFHLSTSFAQADHSQQEKGLSYSNYLQLLLWTMQDQRLAERGMDMMEKNTGVQMDSLVSRAECSYTFEAPAVFWSFITLGQHSFGTYQIEEEAEISFCAETE